MTHAPWQFETHDRRRARRALATAVLVLLPLLGAANPLKKQVDALYRPIDGRLLKLQTLLPPRRDAEGNEQPRQRGCPDKVVIGGMENDNRASVRNFAPRIHIDGPLVIRCR